MIALETQEAGTGKWFPVIIYTPGVDSQRESAVDAVKTLRFLGLYARITETK